MKRRQSVRKKVSITKWNQFVKQVNEKLKEAGAIKDGRPFYHQYRVLTIYGDVGISIHDRGNLYQIFCQFEQPHLAQVEYGKYGVHGDGVYGNGKCNVHAFTEKEALSHLAHVLSCSCVYQKEVM